MSEENSSAVEAPSTFDSVSDAVAELDRRDAARAEAKAEEKAARAASMEHSEARETPATDAPEPDPEPDEPEADHDASDEVATDDEDQNEPEERAIVNLDGKEIEIPKGTPRALVEAVKKLESDFRADYTRKTQEVAAERQQVTQRLSGVLQKYGMTGQELGTVTDHRVLLMLRDLEKYHGRQQAAGTVREKLANVPPKTQKPGTATQDGGRSNRAAQAKQQFMKSGRSMRDVARYLAQSQE